METAAYLWGQPLSAVEPSAPRRPPRLLLTPEYLVSVFLDVASTTSEIMSKQSRANHCSRGQSNCIDAAVDRDTCPPHHQATSGNQCACCWTSSARRCAPSGRTSCVPSSRCLA